MANSDKHEYEATISATVSDNETPTTMTTLPNASDDGAQRRASGETMTTTMKAQRMEVEDEGKQSNKEKRCSDPVQKDSPEISDKESKGPPLPFLRLRSFRREDSSSSDGGGEPKTPDSAAEDKEPKIRPLSFMKVPKLKREKSSSEILERKKKRVKFSPNDNDGDVLVDTRVFEPQFVGRRAGEDDADSDVSCKIKKLLRRRSRRKQSTIETQTEDEKKKEIEDNEKRQSRDDAFVTNKPPSSAEQDRVADIVIHDKDGDVCFHDISSPEKDALNIQASASDSLQVLNEQPSSGTALDGANIVVQEAEVPYSLDQRESLLSTSHSAAASPEKAPLQEEQELEISGIKDAQVNVQVPSDSNLSTSFEDDLTSSTSQGSVKREGTFTLDGPPPAKITRSSCDVAEDTAVPLGNTPPRESIMEPLHFYVDLSESEGKLDPDNKSKEVKSKMPKNAQSAKSVRIVEPAPKKQEESSLTVKALKNTAKKTFACAWRTALKSPDSPEQTPKAASKSAAARPRTPSRSESTTPRSSPTKSDTLHRSSPTKQESVSRSSPTKDKPSKLSLQRKLSDSKLKSVTLEKIPEPKSPKESLRLSRPLKRTPHQHPDSPRTPPERTSVWAGVSLPSFKREGTFTKKYDSERDRLQAECNRLNVEKERLQSELNEARERLDEEVAARKALKRNNEMSLRQLREDEIKRSELLIADLRNRLEDEKREALAFQRESLTRTHESELLKLDRERDDDQRKLLCEARLTEERLKAEIRRETHRLEQQQQQKEPAKQCCHASEREVERLNRDLSTLRDHKKRLEEIVQTLQETERKRAGELRRLHEEHEAAIAKIHRINKTEAAKLLDELRAKERTITNLEKQVSAQSAKIRLQEEKQRELSNDRSEDGRKQSTRGGGSSVSSKKNKEGGSAKDGRIREKESSSSSISTASNLSNSGSSLGSNLILVPPPSSTPVPPTKSFSSAATTPMEQSIESGISMASENEDLRLQLENARLEVDQLLKKTHEQQETIEANLLKIAEQKEIIDDQQIKIHDLTEEAMAMDRECMALATSPPVWPPRRESCVKVCELPTVLEQSSDEELSPTSSPTTPDPSPHHTFDHQEEDLYDEETDHPHTPTAFLTPTTPGTEPPIWPQATDNKYGSQYAQLSRVSDEWQNLLASTSNASSPCIDIGDKDCLAQWYSSSRVLELEAQNSRLEADLQEARDHADLLEFRILEFTEGADRISEAGVCVQTCDQSTATDFDDVSIPTTNEDLSLPLSIDSGLDISNDYKARITEGRAWLAQLSLNDPDSPAAQHLAALLDWVATIPPTHTTHHGLSSPMSPTLATPAPTPKTGMGGEEEIRGDIGRDLMLLATRLQESLNDPTAQEPLLLDTIAKLRVLDASLSQLQERVVSLTEENRELQEAVTTLSDAHETRTEASGTESELVHRKTPSIHSDLSDAEESDAPEHAQQHHRSVKLVTLDASTSFQESGIFDTSCELVHVTTQTELTQVTDAALLEADRHKSECELREAEVDLQSAVARLATIRSAVQGRDLRHLRLQDLQESDEYLRTCLDERVVLSKLEYDGIVESERCLQRELEHLKCEKDQLGLECEALRGQIRDYKASRGTDAEEALKGEIRVLKQKLMVSERSRLQVFEEKCELEEEENDSRLMVQRLEAQMEAAREMENLLSASLSQEQEISRELHRRVRDLQILEKEHRGRLEKLEQVSREAEEKAVSLAAAREQLAMQLTFAAYGLMLVDSWRLMVPNPTAAIVPYTGKTLKVSPEVCPTMTAHMTTEVLDHRESSPTVNDCDKCLCPPVMCDVHVQTCNEFPVVSAAVQTDDVDAQCVNKESPNLNVGVDHGQRRLANRDEDEPLNKRPRNTRSQSTMTFTSEGPTEREQYYLEQIEALQREKINLRKGHETDRRDSLQQHSDLEEVMEEMRQELQVAKEDNCTLVFRLEETQDKNEEMKQNYVHKIEELKGDMSRYKEMYEQEKKSLQKDYELRVKEVEKLRDLQEERVHQLEIQLANFRQELEIVGVSLATDLVEFDTDMENVLSQGGPSSMKCADDGELIRKIRELAKSETALRQKIYDLEKKECAYRETIREADKIMSSHVTSYKQRIEDLEATIEQQVSRIQQLEASEERLRSSLRNNSRTSEGARISDLLDRLIETENSELKLKERVWTLERSEKELQIKLMEGEKNNQSLRGELRDQEELVHRLRALETENNALSVELNQAQDSARKMSEVQQSESYLRGRVEELEVTENMLRETLHQADLILAQRERKLRDQVSSLQEEVQAYKAQLEAAASKEYGARESEISYRRQLEELKSRLADAERELKESSSETMSHETQHRSEVTKLRNQLKLSNSQLTELDRLNCELRDRVLAAQAEGQRLAKELEERGRRHEQDLISFNLQMSSRDSRIEEMEHQIEQISHVRAVSELDALASSPIASLHASITALTSALKSCESCKETQSGTLTEVTTQLGTLAELLEGQSNSDIEDIVSDTDEEEPHDAENLAHEATSTPPPNPAGEGPREHSSGDVVCCSTGGRLKRDFRRRSRRRLEERNSRRLVRPQGSTTILEELEEKVRELEEAVGRKDEEIRLADDENCELNSQLQKRDAALQQKGEEVENLNSTLASLRQQLMHTMEDYERSKLSLQAKHKVDVEQFTHQIEQLTKEVEQLVCRGKLKDSIISTLASQIRAILRSGNMSVVINQLRRLQEVDSDQEKANSEGMSTTDFDVEAVCSLLNQPDEMVSLSQSAFLNGIEPSSYVTSESNLPCSIQELTSHVTCQGSPSLVERRKSRIPRYIPSPLSLPSPKSTPVPVDRKSLKQSLMPECAKLQAEELDRKAKSKVSCEQRVRSTSEAAHHFKFTSSVAVNKVLSEPMETESTPEVKEEDKIPSSPPPVEDKAIASTTPTKITGRKDSTRRERPARYLSDARKIKRMVTGVAPLDAAVDCASAPEWRSRSPLGSTSEVEVTCVPRPQNLHITRRVGVDGVVIAWAPLEHDCVAGFQVLVGGRVVQHVRSPHRTKALVTGLPLAGSFTIGLVTMAEDGRCSTPVIVTQDRTRVYTSRSSSARPLRRGVPTCL